MGTCRVIGVCTCRVIEEGVGTCRMIEEKSACVCGDRGRGGYV